MSSIPVPDERTRYSSRRQDDVDALAWPVFSQGALDLLRSAGEVLHPEPGALLWDTGDSYDLYLVLAGGVLLLDRPDNRVVFVVEEGDFVGELGMLMGQGPSFRVWPWRTPRCFACRSRSCAGSWRSRGS
jgi:thioredoxin reductase (NADPH)